MTPAAAAERRARELLNEASAAVAEWNDRADRADATQESAASARRAARREDREWADYLKNEAAQGHAQLVQLTNKTGLKPQRDKKTAAPRRHLSDDDAGLAERLAESRRSLALTSKVLAGATGSSRGSVAPQSGATVGVATAVGLLLLAAAGASLMTVLVLAIIAAAVLAINGKAKTTHGRYPAEAWVLLVPLAALALVPTGSIGLLGILLVALPALYALIQLLKHHR